MLLSYDGASFGGWQRHPGQRTVQGVIEAALTKVYGKDAVTIEGAGRTDRGAHAEGQVASVDAPPGNTAEYFGEAPVDILNGLLPPDVRVRAMAEVPGDFHARRSALGKTYRYALWLRDQTEREAPPHTWSVGGDIDTAAMKHAASMLLGTHDFGSFATKKHGGHGDTTRTMERVSLELPETGGPLVHLHFEAEGFLYKMVRSIVRAILRVGEGRWSTEDLAAALEAKDRSRSPGSAPASGLTLESVRYAADLFPLDSEVPPKGTKP